MALPQKLRKRAYTIEEYYALPEGTRAEYVDGQIYFMSPAPSRMHQDICFALSRKIADYIDDNKGSCKIYLSPFDVVLDIIDEENNITKKHIFQPDISVICDISKLTDDGCTGAPDWIIEVASPNNSIRDYVLKLNKYMAAGVREYWIVDPMEKTILIYFFEDNKFAEKFTFNDKIKVNIYDDCYIDFKELNI